MTKLAIAACIGMVIETALLVGNGDVIEAQRQEIVRLKSELAARPTISLSDPLCPSNVWVSQRVDKRKHGKIVWSRWERKCQS